MTITHLNLGTADNDGLGTKLKPGGQIINDNFDYLEASLANKADLASPAFTGNPTVPTQAGGNNTTRAASTAFVRAEIASLVNSAPGTLDTLGEIAAQLASDESAATALATTVAGKQAGHVNLTALSGLAGLADKIAYFTGAGAMALTSFTTFARTLLAATDGPAFAKLLGGSYVIAKSAVAVSLTGTTAETTLATITIPANSLGPNGQVEISAVFSLTNNGNAKTPRFKFGSMVFQLQALTGNATSQILGRLANRNATNSQVSFPGSGTGIGSGAALTIVTAAIDTTANVDLVITGQLANSGDTITLESYLVRITPGS